MTSALTASRFFGGCIENARAYLFDHAFVPTMLSKSRLMSAHSSTCRASFAHLFERSH